MPSITYVCPFSALSSVKKSRIFRLFFLKKISIISNFRRWDLNFRWFFSLNINQHPRLHMYAHFLLLVWSKNRKKNENYKFTKLQLEKNSRFWPTFIHFSSLLCNLPTKVIYWVHFKTKIGVLSAPDKKNIDPPWRTLRSKPKMF